MRKRQVSQNGVCHYTFLELSPGLEIICAGGSRGPDVEGHQQVWYADDLKMVGPPRFKLSGSETIFFEVCDESSSASNVLVIDPSCEGFVESVCAWTGPINYLGPPGPDKLSRLRGIASGLSWENTSYIWPLDSTGAVVEATIDLHIINSDTSILRIAKREPGEIGRAGYQGRTFEIPVDSDEKRKAHILGIIRDIIEKQVQAKEEDEQRRAANRRKKRQLWTIYWLDNTTDAR